MPQPPTQDINPVAPPTDPLPPLRAEHIAATGYDVLNAMHEATIVNLRQALDPQLNFPSLWRLAKTVVNEQGPIIIYRYAEEE